MVSVGNSRSAARHAREVPVQARKILKPIPRYYARRGSAGRILGTNLFSRPGSGTALKSKDLSAAAKLSESDLVQFIDMIPALAWAADADGHPAFFNRYYLDYVGQSQEEMMDDGWARNLHPDDVPILLADWMAIMASRREGTSRARMRGADGQYRWFLFRANPLHDESGNVIRWFGVNTDIEDRKRIEETLLNTQAQLAHMTRVMTMGQLTASIAHELNQPLAGIITNAGTCLRMLGAEPPNVEGALATARRTIRDGNRASEVIARLRALFTNKNTAAEPIDLNAAAQEVIALASTELQRASVSLRTGLAENLPQVIGDRIQLQQVILNLIMNAMEAMSEIDYRPREIVVTTAREDTDHVRLSVQDVGVGLGGAAAEKLFTPFYTTKSAGMGIGLSVCRSIVEHHHGRIWAEKNDGPGATFRFSLPVRPDEARGEQR